MNRTVVCALALCSLAALPGCNGCNKTVPDALDAGAPGAPEAAAPLARPDATVRGDAGRGPTPPPWATVPGATAALLPNMGIPDRFQVEASSRPAGLKINVESVYAALAKSGLVIVEKKQHLGQTFGARYCVGARVVKAIETDPTQLYLSVCEFISNEVAESSRVYSTEALKQITNRVIHTKQQTTLTVRGESDAPDIVAQSQKALAVYDAL